jgi:FlaA1/EpsC-like NDP-sugar epimerase
MAIFHGFEISFLNIKTLCLLPVDWGASLHATPPPFRLWEIVDDNFTGEAAGILVIISAVFVAFSKERKEDEYIAKIRLESLLWATYITFAIQIFCLLFFYGMRFFESMVVNLFTILFVFIARYYFIIYRSKFQRNEE